MSSNRHINIPIFIPHLGCPHTCVFCDQKKISGARLERSLEKVREQIDKSLATAKAEDNVEIAFFGGSFTGIPEDEMLAYLEIARTYIEAKKVNGIRMSTRPDYINPHILDILKAYGTTAIELGVQSLDDEVLALSQRGHTAAQARAACALIKKAGIKLGIQTMLGLPGDTFEKSLKTAHEVVELKPDMVRIYPAVILEGTALEKLYREGTYTPLGLEEAVEWCSKILPLYRQAGITVLRTGLHASDSLESGIVAGPYHPAFGELVESKILLDKVCAELDKLMPLNTRRIVIRTCPEKVSKLVGQRRANIRTLKEKYGLESVIIQPDLEQGEFAIEAIAPHKFKEGSKVRTIGTGKIIAAVEKLCIEANIYLNEDIKQALIKGEEAEESDTGRSILDSLVKNAEIAAGEKLAICQDTGMVVLFIEIGQDVHIAGGSLEEALNEGVRRGYKKGCLRSSVVADPLRRDNTGDNTPAIIHYSIVKGDKLTIHAAPKGFGSENMSSLIMLKPSDGVEGVKKAVIETVSKAGANPCPPIIVGVGIGGSMEKAALLAKKALMRPIDQRHPDPYYKALEEELLESINKLGIGPAGLGGRITALGVNVETYPTHIAGLPVAVNIGCHVTRHRSVTL